MRLTVTTLALALLVPFTAAAQDPPPPPPPVPSPADVPPPAPEPLPPAPLPMEPVAPPAPVTVAPPAVGALSFEALVDTFYMFNFTGDPTVQPPGLRAFDTVSNSFSLGYAELAAQLAAEPVGFRMDIGYGHTGGIINGLMSAAPYSTTSTVLSGAASQLHADAWIMQQAYATAKFSDQLTLDAGRFVTTTGAEVIESHLNWNYSRSLLFNGIPLIHTGLRLNVRLNDQLALQFSVVNSALGNDPDNNADKTYGASLALTPAVDTTVIATTYIGKEGALGAEGDMSILVDVVAAKKLSETLALNLNFDYSKTGPANWLGLSAMVKAVLSDSMNLALRGEFIKTKNGYSPIAALDGSIYEGTATLGLPFGSAYEIRAELRGDFSDKEIFLKGAAGKKNQFTGLVAFLAHLP